MCVSQNMISSSGGNQALKIHGRYHLGIPEHTALPPITGVENPINGSNNLASRLR